MENKKQSSIELFAIALYEKGFLKGNGDEINDLLEEHKAIHKEEVISFAKKCLDKALDTDVRTAHSKAEELYNETFGGNNE